MMFHCGFDSSFEFAAKTMLLDRRRVLSVLRQKHITPPERGRIHPFSSEVKMPVLIILIVVSVLILMRTGQCDQCRPQRPSKITIPLQAKR